MKRLLMVPVEVYAIGDACDEERCEHFRKRPVGAGAPRCNFFSGNIVYRPEADDYERRPQCLAAEQGEP